MHLNSKHESNSYSQPIVFLLGAGASIPGGFPSTSELTDCVLSGEGVKRYSYGLYHLRSTGPDAEVKRITDYLRIIKNEIDSYYKNNPERKANYEDLYYVTSQIADSKSGETDNPVVQTFIEKLRPQISAILKRYPCGRISTLEDEDFALKDLNKEASNYIHDVVWRKLEKKAESECHLSWLADACEDQAVSKKTIATLNHDTSLETYLQKRGIEPYDGFGDPENSVRYWEWKPGANNKRDSVTLLKLHGSIDWFRLYPEESDGYDDRKGIPLKRDIDSIVDDKKRRLKKGNDGRPKLLIGTFNKLYSYAAGMFFDLHHMFREALRESKHLVVAGYGFGDKGINSHIIDWLFSSKENRITVVHPRPEKLMQNARRAIERLKDSPSLSFVEKRVEKISWSELKRNEEETHRSRPPSGGD